MPVVGRIDMRGGNGGVSESGMGYQPRFGKQCQECLFKFEDPARLIPLSTFTYY